MKKSLLVMSRQSAGTISPAERFTMSPGTTLESIISCRFPSLMTVTVVATLALRASAAFSAFDSWKKSRKTLRRTMTMMIAAFGISPTMPEMSPAKMRMMTSGFRKSSRNLTTEVRFLFLATSFGPYFWRAVCAWASVSPVRELSSLYSTSSTDRQRISSLVRACSEAAAASFDFFGVMFEAGSVSVPITQCELNSRVFDVLRLIPSSRVCLIIVSTI